MTALPHLRVMGDPAKSLPRAGDNIHRLVDYFNRLSGAVSALESGADGSETLTNDSGGSLSAGTLIGVSGGLLTAASAAAAGPRALAVVPQTTANGASFTPGVAGAYRVRTDGSGGFTAGGAVWLSAGTAGTATSTRPVSPNFSQLVGFSSTATVDPDGRILILLNVIGTRVSHV